jgi:hypothetical protein
MDRAFIILEAAMVTSHRVRCCGPLLVLLLILAAPALAPAQSQWQRLPPEMRTAMERNAAGISPISLTMLRTPSAPRSQDETISLMGAGFLSAESMFRSERTRFVWQGSQFFMEQTNLSEPEGAYRTATDGHVLYSLQVPDTGRYPRALTSLLRSRPHTLPGAYGHLGVSYLPSVGVSTSGAAHTPSVQPRIQRLIETGAVLTGVHMVRDGARVLPIVTLRMIHETQARAQQLNLENVASQLRRGSGSEEQIQEHIENIRRQRQLPAMMDIQFTLDPELGYAVRRIDERYPDGTLVRRIENTDFMLIDERGIWLPRRVRTDYHAFPATTDEIFDHAMYSVNYEIEGAFGLEPQPDDLFSITEVDVGTHVSDDLSSSSRQVQFIVEPGMEHHVREFLAGRRAAPVPAAEDPELAADSAEAHPAPSPSPPAAASTPQEASTSTQDPTPSTERRTGAIVAVAILSLMALFAFFIHKRTR